jgi:hypothetical protein
LKRINRFFAVKLVFDDEGITIANPGKTLRYRWDEVASMRWHMVSLGYQMGMVPALQVDTATRPAMRTASLGPLAIRLATAPEHAVATYAPSCADQENLMRQASLRASRHGIPFTVNLTIPRPQHLSTQ